MNKAGCSTIQIKRMGFVLQIKEIDEAKATSKVGYFRDSKVIEI